MVGLVDDRHVLPARHTGGLRLGYRGWGPPYPSYFQRQRDLQASSAGASGAFNHYSWGWGGDFVWLILFVGIFWVATAMWWPVWR